jgi:hypothetical protein
MMPTPRRRAALKGRSALAWFLTLFAAGQAALGVWLYRCHPELCDPNWGYREAHLRDRLAEAPGRPLVLFVGSSRPANGFNPRGLGDWRPRGRPAPVVFNFATLGGGPVRELLTLRRLLARGIRPEWVLVEAWPPFWAGSGHYDERPAILSCDFHWSDLPVLAHVYGCRWSAFSQVCQETLFPFFHARGGVLFTYAPLLVARNAEADVEGARLHWLTLDDWGWLPVPWERGSPEAVRRGLEYARQYTQPVLEKLTLTPAVDWSIRQFVQECRGWGIKVAFVVLPEHSVLRGWYTPGAQAVFTGYLRRLQEEYGTPVIDARDWVGDDDFHDSSHLRPSGAAVFSARFGPEVLRPLLEGRPLPAQVLLRPACSDEATLPPGP